MIGLSSFPGEYSSVEPPDPFPNSVVKRSSANDSVGTPHANVGHRQVLFKNSAISCSKVKCAGVAQLVEQLTCNQ